MTKKTNLTLLIVTILASTGCTQKEVQLQTLDTYYSSNKSFCIDVPSDYTLHYTLPNYMSFLSQSQGGSIMIERELFMGYDKNDFKKYILKKQEEIPSKFRRLTISENDSICHYKHVAGMFVVHQYYMRKLIEGYSYIIDASGMKLNDDLAKCIYNSVNNK